MRTLNPTSINTVCRPHPQALVQLSATFLFSEPYTYIQLLVISQVQAVLDWLGGAARLQAAGEQTD